MEHLVAKYLNRPTLRKTREATCELDRACRSSIRQLKRSISNWRPREDEQSLFFARAILETVVRYAAASVRMLRGRNPIFVSCAMDLTRTALENTFVLVIVSREGQVGMDYIFEWANRLEAKKLGQSLKSPYGDEEDKAAFSEALERTYAILKSRKFPRATVHEILDRAALGDWSQLVYSFLNPYSHFDFGKTMQTASRFMEKIAPEMISTGAERICFARYCLLVVLLYAELARRDLGDSGLSNSIEKGSELIQRHQETALQVKEGATAGT